MDNTQFHDIELRIERMQTSLTRQEAELESWRHRSSRLPSWIRNGGVALFFALFAQSMTAVWWASEITNTQTRMTADVQINTDYRVSSTERYNDIMIELTRIQVTLEQKLTNKD